MYLKPDIHFISSKRGSNMFRIHVHLFSLCLVLSFKNIESRNIHGISKPLYETIGAKVVKTGIITKWLFNKANKFLLLSSFLLLAKPKVQNVTEKEDIVKKSKSVNFADPINIVPYPRNS